MARGKARRKKLSAASHRRKRMISRNFGGHPEKTKPRYVKLKQSMPENYKKLLAKVLKTKEGKKALARYRKFWGLPFPTNIRFIEVPGPKNKTQVLVGMGRSPGTILADGPKGRGKPRFKRQAGLVATNADGTRIMILSGKNSRSKSKAKKFVGYAAQTHYVPTSGMEKAGTFKRGKYWIHEMGESGGNWPKAYEDSAGNVWYGPGSYRVTDWIRR